MAWFRADLGWTVSAAADQSYPGASAVDASLAANSSPTNDCTIFTSGGLNDHAYAQFENTSPSTFNVVKTLGGSADRINVWMVARYNAATTDDNILLVSNGVSHQCVISNPTPSTWRARYKTTEDVNRDCSVSGFDQTWHYFKAALDGTNASLRVDNGTASNVADAGSQDLSLSSSRIIVNGTTVAGDNSANVDYHEIVIANAAATAAEDAGMDAYFNARYAQGW